jgi:DNA-nicking Smr family endonuclease
MMARRHRVLSPEERRLWAEFARGIVPLRGRHVPEAPPAEPAPDNPLPPQPIRPPNPARQSDIRPALPPLAPLERKARLKLRRGIDRPDAILDLHGMRQIEAHGELVRFLARAQTRGHGLVLVVTGKGGAPAGEGLFEERGVLRRMVPHWLRLPDLRPIVLGFEEASPQHGGSGALYVRLRRRSAGLRP